MNSRVSSALLCAMAMGLVACDGGDQEELRQWVKEETKDLRGRIPPLPKVLPYEPVPYDAYGLVDPFRPARLKQEGKAGGAMQPDMNRPREPLESFPLESLMYVGILAQGKQRYAIVFADGALHQVKAGNYIGQNFGVVTKISDSELTLRELVQDPAGDWMERTSTLQLQQQPKEGK